MATKRFEFDDGDMKIAGEKTIPAHASVEDVHATLAEMKHIREKGLLLQAQQVGAHMAAFVAEIYSCQENTLLSDQQIWLSVFAVTVGCESCVHNATAARAVLNAFHDRFKELCPDAYEHSGYSIAMSFYYLAVRSVGDSRKEIGRTFAMLCNQEADPALQQLGCETFDRCIDRMASLSEPLNQEV